MKKFLLVLTALLVLTSVAGAAQPEYSYEGHVYKLVYGNWFEAQQSAEAWGGDLVTINNALEETWLQSIFGVDPFYWIGLTDKDAEGTWTWMSREPVSYTNWYSEPYDEGGEDFSFMNYCSQNKWKDAKYCYLQIGIAEKVVPEPISAGLFVLGGGALALIRRKKTA